jgi:hypothetical protein
MSLHACSFRFNNTKQLLLSIKTDFAGIGEVRRRVLVNEVVVDANFQLDMAHGVRNTRVQNQNSVLTQEWSH